MKINMLAVISFFLGFLFAAMAMTVIFMAPTGYGIYKTKDDHNGATIISSVGGMRQNEQFKITHLRSSDTFKINTTLLADHTIVEAEIVQDKTRLGMGYALRNASDLLETESISFSTNGTRVKFNFSEKKDSQAEPVNYVLQEQRPRLE